MALQNRFRLNPWVGLDRLLHPPDAADALCTVRQTTRVCVLQYAFFWNWVVYGSSSDRAGLGNVKEISGTAGMFLHPYPILCRLDAYNYDRCVDPC